MKSIVEIVMKKTFVIGDVHGCFYTLMDLVKKLPKNSEMIFTGDLCDKGFYSKEVIEFVKNNARCVLGNHDNYMSKYLKSSMNGESFEWNTSDEYAGYTTVSSYLQCDEKLINNHIDYIKSLPFYIQIDKYFITHGFGLPYYQRKDNDEHKFSLSINRLSNRRHEYDYEVDFEKYDIINIFGHDTFDEVFISQNKNYYGIDTGCKYLNKLTAIELGSMKIIQVKTNVRDILKT